MTEGGPPSPDPIEEGLRLFNEGFFFEAHEVLEDAWHVERGEPRRFLQGLIQLCAGFHHLSNGNPTGARSLFEKAAEKLRGYPEDYLRLDVKGLLAHIDAARGQLAHGEEVPRLEIRRSR